MREILACEGRRRRWLQLMGAVCVCFVPMLVALAQAPTGPRVQFGVVKGVEEKVPATAKPAEKAEKKKPGPAEKGGGVLLYAMPLTPPSPDHLFRLESEDGFRNQLRAEVRLKAPKLTLEFPEADSAPGRAAPRYWPEYVKWVEPNYVVSRRLLFEQRRFERYGDSLGVLQPAVSTGIFGIDVFLWPARRLTHPFQCYQVNTDCYSPYFQTTGE